MKKLQIKYIAIILSLIIFASCSKVLDKQSLVNSNADQVYNDSATAVLSLNYIYTQNLPSWFGNGSVSAIGSAGPCNLTEECRSDNIYVKGTVTQETVGDIGTSNSAGTNYGKIRAINQFIQDVNAGTINSGTKNRFIAQALFWRAFRYFELVKLYGGVPLVLKPLPAVGSAAKAAAMVPRSSTTATFQQIVADLDTAINYLPPNWSAVDYGRITKGAAQAYLGRVLLTWASPQFNPNNDVNRWQAAYDASTAAIATLSANGYGLYPKEDVTMWTTEGANSDGTPKNPEAVMVTEYNPATDANGMANNNYTNATLPKYIGTSGGSTQPTWDEVQAFPMADGYAPGSSPNYTYNPQTFFLNRDPRFYQTIAYNGCSWPVVGNANYRLWTYYYYTKANGTATKSTETSASSTGFYCRKAIDPNISASNLMYSGTDWMEIRYAEVLLNQAESAAEIGHLGIGQEAYNNLIAIRKRAGILPGTNSMYGLQTGMDQTQMINAIMFERQIEFAYEGRRYWDLRRRNLLEGTLNGKMRQGLTIVLNNTGTASDYALLTRDASSGNTNASLAAYYLANFSVTPVNVDTYPIDYQTADHFFGIPTAALQNNTALIQNNTWGGSFDPLQ
ncbi:RagB/SusD family nutrient uptake outer membrane protein [Arachidicoccus soli]|uniref:RagB/SusD family nutrient uptake outer membrane protein n=1 Tax=Arachidicoccus soli TaxID=2341117 RepID=A0A386HPA3_9BACT|nr:RagB/SusD family nutrient uptake outer membrane protein [Arachidicoccus soli]AYD47665.1 RagB/SusD family nutrient uptake outer membrane protein [Arachidicoccus soli]